MKKADDWRQKSNKILSTQISNLTYIYVILILKRCFATFERQFIFFCYVIHNYSTLTDLYQSLLQSKQYSLKAHMSCISQPNKKQISNPYTLFSQLTESRTSCFKASLREDERSEFTSKYYYTTQNNDQSVSVRETQIHYSEPQAKIYCLKLIQKLVLCFNFSIDAYLIMLEVLRMINIEGSILNCWKAAITIFIMAGKSCQSYRPNFSTLLQSINFGVSLQQVVEYEATILKLIEYRMFPYHNFCMDQIQAICYYHQRAIYQTQQSKA